VVHVDCEQKTSRAMPIYFFGVNDQPADQATVEELPHDRAAREWATRVAQEVNRNRRHPLVRVNAYRSDGSLVE
jgi:hypothetical protein